MIIVLRVSPRRIYTSSKCLFSAITPRNTPSPRYFSRHSHLYNNKKLWGKQANEPSKIRVKWFYATDVPLSKPEWFDYTKENDAKKFIPFSDYDSSQLEKRFQELGNSSGSSDVSPIVEVNEDKLFQVDLNKLNIAPVYWEGPIYEVRRGTWFGSDGIPLPSHIARAIESGYQRFKPYNFKVDNDSMDLLKFNKDVVGQFNKIKDRLEVDAKSDIKLDEEPDLIELDDGQLVLFHNGTDASIFPNVIKSTLDLNVLRNFGPRKIPMISITNIQRGYTDDLGESILSNIAKEPIPKLADTFENEIGPFFGFLSSDSSSESGPKETKSANNQMKDILETDYDHDVSATTSNRDVDHLILCVHGIGQVLGDKYESVNFTHSINVLRNTMKNVYKSDDRYRHLAYPGEAKKTETSSSNNRIQVLPISWRHRVDFHPSKPVEKFDKFGKHRLPTLSQITVDGVKPLRNILGDVILDILLYYEPMYVKQIFSAVTDELNRVYELYKERNPNFKGKVHILGHSLGSAIALDIMSNQTATIGEDVDISNDLKFEVHDLFCVGSPAGMFKLLEEKNIVARSLAQPEDSDKYISPKCKNLYNIFHPCDAVGYRMEPLVSPAYSVFKPEPIPFASKGLNEQIKEFASFGDGLSEKITKASSWFTRSGGKKEEATSIEDKAAQENALGDIITSLARSDKKSDSKGTSKKIELDGAKLNPLLELNRTGRVDYCLPMGVFDISLVAAVSAHISYFEDEDTAGFIMKEVLTSDKPPVKAKTFSTYK
ncbi:DDHD domain-containing protein [Scheffersomyces xylosifermentans]|uniref:DDHD domain-containing protein n=1 Tax=Scheffersomyces xylosifermentans TaxID=1304137 RepID=UPI00315C6290